MQIDRQSEKSAFRDLMSKLVRRSEYRLRYYDSARELLHELRRARDLRFVDRDASVSLRSESLCRELEHDKRPEIFRAIPTCLRILGWRMGNEKDRKAVLIFMAEVADELLTDSLRPTAPPPAP